MEEKPAEESPKNDALIAAKAQEIADHVTAHKEEFERGERVLLFLDECLLHWGDVCGYGWGPRNERVEVAVKNTKTRQPYYGALNALTGEMHLVPYPVADQLSSTDFLTELQYRHPGAKLTICWDNASWHDGPIMCAYLRELNGHLPRLEWPVTCICFAPYAPEQNPIEEVWRQGKAAIQRLRLTAETFAEVVAAFEQQLEGKLFTFAKRLMYGQLQPR